MFEWFSSLRSRPLKIDLSLVQPIEQTKTSREFGFSFMNTLMYTWSTRELIVVVLEHDFSYSGTRPSVIAPYPDLTFWDFFLSPKLKCDLVGKHFADINQITQFHFDAETVQRRSSLKGVSNKGIWTSVLASMRSISKKINVLLLNKFRLFLVLPCILPK